LTAVLVDQDNDSGRSTPVAQVDVAGDEAALLPGWKRARTAVSLPEAYATLKVPSGKHAKSPWRMLLAYGGCGTMISVGYACIHTQPSTRVFIVRYTINNKHDTTQMMEGADLSLCGDKTSSHAFQTLLLRGCCLQQKCILK
jgi:hypothetical protein